VNNTISSVWIVSSLTNNGTTRKSTFSKNELILKWFHGDLTVLRVREKQEQLIYINNENNKNTTK